MPCVVNVTYAPFSPLVSLTLRLLRECDLACFELGRTIQSVVKGEIVNKAYLFLSDFSAPVSSPRCHILVTVSSLNWNHDSFLWYVHKVEKLRHRLKDPRWIIDLCFIMAMISTSALVQEDTTQLVHLRFFSPLIRCTRGKIGVHVNG